MSSLISIVIATYNAESHIRATLDSIAKLDAHERDKLEVIVIDGVSTDNTMPVVREYSQIITQLVCEPDKGIYDAMNKGAAMASGTWLHFLNAGDRFSNGASIERLIEMFEESNNGSEVWAVSGAVNMGGSAGQRRIPNIPHTWWKHALGVQPHCHQACWFRTDVFRAIDGYSLEFGLAGDFDLILRFGILSSPIELADILIEYQGGGVSEKAKDEMPQLLHEIRIRRLSLGGHLKRFDILLGRAVAFMNRVKIAAGAVRSSFSPSKRI